MLDEEVATYVASHYDWRVWRLSPYSNVFVVSATRIQSRFRGARARRRVRLALQQLDHTVYISRVAHAVLLIQHSWRDRRRRPAAPFRLPRDDDEPRMLPRDDAATRLLPTIVPPPPRRWDPEALSAVDMRLHWFAHVLARRATDLPRRMAELQNRLRAMLRVWASPSFDTWCRVAASRRRQRTALSLGARVSRRVRLLEAVMRWHRSARRLGTWRQRRRRMRRMARRRVLRERLAAWRGNGAAAARSFAALSLGRRFGAAALCGRGLRTWHALALRQRFLHDVAARVALAIRTARTRRGTRRAFDAWWDRAAAQRSMRDAARAATSRTATLALLRATLSWELYRRARRDLARRSADAAALVRLMWLRRLWQAGGGRRAARLAAHACHERRSHSSRTSAAASAPRRARSLRARR